MTAGLAALLAAGLISVAGKATESQPNPGRSTAPLVTPSRGHHRLALVAEWDAKGVIPTDKGAEITLTIGGVPQKFTPTHVRITDDRIAIHLQVRDDYDDRLRVTLGIRLTYKPARWVLVQITVDNRPSKIQTGEVNGKAGKIETGKAEVSYP